jgi:hypothetical protein
VVIYNSAIFKLCFSFFFCRILVIFLCHFVIVESCLFGAHKIRFVAPVKGDSSQDW